MAKKRKKNTRKAKANALKRVENQFTEQLKDFAVEIRRSETPPVVKRPPVRPPHFLSRAWLGTPVSAGTRRNFFV